MHGPQRGDGDDAAVRAHRLRVDLRHHERHRGIHAEGGGVVHHHRALLGGERREALGGAATGGEERDVDAAEAVFLQLLHRQRLAAEAHRLACRAGRGEKAQLGEREAALLEAADELDTDGAGGADDRDDRRRAG